jgi:hypothetical protein
VHSSGPKPGFKPGARHWTASELLQFPCGDKLLTKRNVKDMTDGCEPRPVPQNVRHLPRACPARIPGCRRFCAQVPAVCCALRHVMCVCRAKSAAVPCCDA